MRPKVVFDPAKHLPVVANFDCGPEPWSQEVSSWIKAPSTSLDSASRAVERKLVDKVWLFIEDDGSLVGFTSLKRDEWEVEGEPPLPILYIPYLGLSVEFHGKKSPGLAKSYAKILIEDVLHEANCRATYARYHLGLHVQKINEKAIGLYKHYGFRISGEEDIYYRMIVDAQTP